jgi:hypothetical protein
MDIRSYELLKQAVMEKKALGYEDGGDNKRITQNAPVAKATAAASDKKTGDTILAHHNAVKSNETNKANLAYRAKEQAMMPDVYQNKIKGKDGKTRTETFDPSNKDSTPGGMNQLWAKVDHNNAKSGIAAERKAEKAVGELQAKPVTMAEKLLNKATGAEGPNQYINRVKKGYVQNTMKEMDEGQAKFKQDSSMVGGMLSGNKAFRNLMPTAQQQAQQQAQQAQKTQQVEVPFNRIDRTSGSGGKKLTLKKSMGKSTTDDQIRDKAQQEDYKTKENTYGEKSILGNAAQQTASTAAKAVGDVGRGIGTLANSAFKPKGQQPKQSQPLWEPKEIDNDTQSKNDHYPQPSRKTILPSVSSTTSSTNIDTLAPRK